MTLEIRTLNDDGSGYMVVTNDDGTTFGQNFHRMPVHDRDVLLERLSELAREAVARTEQRLPIAQQVAVMIGQPVQSTPNRGVRP